MKRIKLYLWIFSTHLFISAFTFGGGYVVVPMIRKYYVMKKKMFDEEDLMDMAAVAQSSPGAIAINLSALAGYRAAGVAGILVSCTAAVIPPLLILMLVSHWYAIFITNTLVAAVLRGMQAGISAVIVDVVVDMAGLVLKERSLLLTLMIPVSFLASFLFQINVAFVLIVCCLICVGRIWRRRKRHE